jgi:hypothetical protein
MAIAIMDESDHQINFNSLKKPVTSFTSAIAIMDESDTKSKGLSISGPLLSKT